jgi:hypothetical protein
MTSTEIENKLQITEMKGDLKLLNQKIHTIETNHLVHLQKDIDKINKVLWTVGVMVFAQFIWLVKTIVMG